MNGSTLRSPPSEVSLFCSNIILSVDDAPMCLSKICS